MKMGFNVSSFESSYSKKLRFLFLWSLDTEDRELEVDFSSNATPSFRVVQDSPFVGPESSIEIPATPLAGTFLERNVDTTRPQTNASGGSSSIEDLMLECRRRSLNFNVRFPAASTSSAPAKKPPKRLAKKSPKTPQRQRKAAQIQRPAKNLQIQIEIKTAKVQIRPAKETPKTNRITNALSYIFRKMFFMKW